MDDSLDQVWKALSDPTRREILDLLRDRPRRTTDLVNAFPQLSRFGVMKHLEVLKSCQLVLVEKKGREVLNRLNVVPLQQIHERWVSRFEDMWSNQLLNVKHRAESATSTDQNSKS